MFAVIYIPNFSLQAVLRHEPELRACPVALVGEDSAKSKVAQANAAAEAFGIYPGLTSTQAKARCAGIGFRPRSGQQEDAAQQILLECAYVSAAYIESTAPGVCTVDLRGLPLLKAEPLEPALQSWATKLRERIDLFHLAAQIGVASTPALAAQAAQRGQHFCYVDDARQFWAELPIESICPSAELIKILAKWGIRSAGEFLALGKARVAERLGAAGTALYDEVKSDVGRPLRLTAPRQIYEEFFEFEQCVETLEPLLFVVRRLLQQLLQRLEQVSRSISEIGLSLQLESGENQGHTVKIASPTRDADALFRITHNYLESVRTSSPVVAVALKATACEIETEQFQLFETSVRDPNRFYETISRLSALLGPERVGTPALRDSYRSDDFQMLSPTANLETVRAAATSGTLLLEEKLRAPHRGLPLRRFRPPLPAAVRLREGKPLFLDSAGPNGSIDRSQGPWRSSGNWWENLWAREEWDVQMKDGALYRIFLEKNEWFVEGAYD